MTSLAISFCLALFIFLSSTTVHAATINLRIASFNVQVFGTTKMSKPQVVANLTKIFSLFDVACMMEIRDDSGTAFPQLLAKLNEANKNDPYDAVLTSRRGRTSSKEQEAYIFRKRLITNMSYYESTSATFERPPGAVKFKVNNAIPEYTFMMMCEHIQPSNVVTELDELKSEYESTKKRLNVTRGFMCGDFNAGCSYLSKTATSSLLLRQDTANYVWLVNDSMDTTVAVSACPYDRFIADKDLSVDVSVSSVGVFTYDTIYNMSNDEAAEISDHFPIYYTLNVPTTSPTTTSSPTSPGAPTTTSSPTTTTT
eukprot:PhF_6_TR44302/c1_g2_i1/m.68339/K11995/DNASE1L; deoxyribonuclease-1-like protein